MNFKSEFNTRARTSAWEKDREKFINNFKYALEVLNRIDKYYIPNNLLPPNTLEQRIYRLDIGYYGIGKPGGIPSKIVSSQAAKLSSKDCVNDHVIGATAIGEYVHLELRKSNYNINWMVNEWLYENLFLWGTVKVTRQEHKSNNIIRDITISSLGEKLNFTHYKNVSSLI